MNQVGIRELRQDLSTHVRRATRGESVVVTVDGVPTAKLVPFTDQPTERTMEDLIASGKVIPGRRRGEAPPPPPPRIKGGRPSREILDELREDRI